MNDRRPLDPIWTEDDLESGMIGLREHVTRLCQVAYNLAAVQIPGPWNAVGENLQLAASLEDIAANTDIRNTTMMCRPAAEYEAHNSDLAERHLAGVVVTTLVWMAYEAAVTCVIGESALGRPKGALGRDVLLLDFGERTFPFLRSAVTDAITSSGLQSELAGPTTRRLLRSGSWAAIGAEHLRVFRNAMIYGQIRKPSPDDWIDEMQECGGANGAIARFAPNIRLTLLLIQALAALVIMPDEHIHDWNFRDRPAGELIGLLHLIDGIEEKQLPLLLLGIILPEYVDR